ncbi:MAG: CubicO group peptidase (beta-lactamase class C family) [Myxococcota bacterium]|jgi:CubicO group peptidase (beta-lactamase class C family)
MKGDHMPNSKYLASTPESVGIDSEKLEAVFDRAEKEVKEGLLPSVQVAVARNGQLAGMRTFGSALFEGTEKPATDDTLYCVFSCTKAVTSAAAWILIEEGKLSLDEIVADIIPEFASNGKDIVTVEQLFTHTAGFPTAPFYPPAFYDLDARAKTFAKWRLSYEPGSRFIYHPSSSMYVVADIIERRSGMRYDDFIRQRVALPLGLESLWVGLPEAEHHRLADITHVGAELTDADYERMGLPAPPVTEVTEANIQKFNRADHRVAGIPGGGGTMTAADLALFYQALLNGGRAFEGEAVLKPETIAMAREIRSHDLTDIVFQKHANRALGLIIAGDKARNYRGFGHTNSALAFGHGGAGGQIGWGDPETGISIGYCTNGYDRDAIRSSRRGIGISSRAASCALP